jgi:transglutaminase-like putative cysteine protease
VRYRIRHRTTYGYAREVFESFNQVRLQPMASESQTVLDFDLSIDPPAGVITFRDYYGNAVHDFGIPYLHDHLTIDATSDVVTHAGADEPLAGPRPEDADVSPTLRSLVEDEAFADSFAEFLGPSAYVVLDEETAAISAALVAGDPEATAYTFFLRAADEVSQRLTYQVGATTVNSSVAEVLAGGQGVCQDYAHVLISLCRHAGLPARYASGYLGSVQEATASHAWAEAYLPPYGWVGVDATAGGACTGRHVKVGVGRDYADVSVLRGTYQGGGPAALEVLVTSETLGTADAVAELRGTATERRGRLVAIQNLGAVRRFQRSPVVIRAIDGLAQGVSLEEIPPPRGQERAGDDQPTSQPQQQQQPEEPPCTSA